MNQKSITTVPSLKKILSEPSCPAGNGSSPDPSDENVQIRKRKGGRFAVIRFDGRSNSDTLAKAEKQLTRWMSDQGFVRDGDSEFAGYDPPWTPGPWRRNEVIIRLK